MEGGLEHRQYRNRRVKARGRKVKQGWRWVMRRGGERKEGLAKATYGKPTTFMPINQLILKSPEEIHTKVLTYV